MSAAVNAIYMTLIQQPYKGKLLLLKTKARSFHTNASHRNTSHFILTKLELYSLTIRKVTASVY